MVKEADIIVIGDAFVDIVILADNLLPGGVHQRRISVTPGGLANTAVWASRLGVKSAFIGKVGNDYLGDMYYLDLVKEKVRPYLSKSSIKPTGICVSLIDETKERTMIIERGACNELKKEDIPLEIIKKAKYVYFSGYSFAVESLLNELVDVIKQIKKYKTKVVFNAGAYNIIDKNNQLFKKIIKNYVDILILNGTEARSLTREGDLISIYKNLKSLTSGFIITLGNHGSIAFDGKNKIKTHIIPIKNVIDTTGAGDAFAGVFLSSFIKKSFEESIKQGHKTAGKVVQRIGAR